MKYLDRNSLQSIFERVYEKDFEDVNIQDLKLSPALCRWDGYNFLKKGDLIEYLIKPFRNKQPKVYEALLSNSNNFFYSIKKTDLPQPIGNDFTQFGILINDIAIYIEYTIYSNQENKTIPFEILNSWLLNSSRWDIADGLVSDVFKSCLPSMILNPIHSIISNFDKKQNHKKYCDFIEEKFNHLFVRNYQDSQYDDRKKYCELRCLLDTRPKNDYSNTGFQLFVSSHNTKRNVYVVPNSDVFQIKQLDNPSDAIDSYAEHIFSRKEGEFDFMKYAKEF